MSGPPPFWRFLPDRPALNAEMVRRAGQEGRGSLARLLREARSTLGAHRTAALMRSVRAGGATFGQPLRVLVASPFQPRAILDALDVGFAIAGFAAEFVALDGHAALDARLGRESSPGAPIDLALMPVIAEDARALALTLGLAGRLADREQAPVLVARIGANADGDAVPTPAGVDVNHVSVPGAAIDERFASTFGLLPSEAAADRLADVAAGFASRLKGTGPKLVVTDLDGTLWRGTLGEDGAAGLVLNHAYAESLQRAAGAGLVLAVASRNQPSDVEEAFASHPEWPLSRADFASLSVGWEEKDDLVAHCLASLNLGAEHMLVVDDDAVNCARLAARFPDADIRHFDGAEPGAFAKALADDLSVFGGASRERGSLYRRREAVERLRDETADLTDFLRKLDTRLLAEPLRAELLPRAAELAARVNQFALTDHRPNAFQLAARQSPLDFMLRLDDAFGAHGLVGLVLAHQEGDEAVLDNFLLSCRALGRQIEDAMLAALAERAAAFGSSRLRAEIEDLPRNEPARRWFSRYGTVAHPTRLLADIPSDAFLLPEDLRLTWKIATN